jgi:DNA-binding beta-propeller fold protein YncE
MQVGMNTVGSGEHTYEWIDNWARIPDSSDKQTSGRTHAVAITKAGAVVVFNQGNPAILHLCPGSGLLSSWGSFSGAHGMCLVNENGTDYLWLTDRQSGQVIKTTLNGQTVQTIERPSLPIYEKSDYSPTWVAANESRFGGNGDIWIADGDGANCIHRFDKPGRHLSTITGEEGRAGAFRCPHGIWFDWRHGQPELYIADHGNRQVQVYDASGRFKRVFGQDFLSSPCSFASHGPYLLIAELHARVTILDEDDKPVCYLGANEVACKTQGWPDLPSYMLEPGKFNCPHGIAADAEGNVYVVESIPGGRITKLIKC